ncbi:MAG: hypothetical protein ACR2JI_12170 [Mycobacterium sp.]
MTLLLRAVAVLGLVSAATVGASPTATAEPADPGSWPVAQGDFTTPADPGWIFFRPMGFEGGGCGIGPDGTVGCDIVPGRWPDGTPVQAGEPGPPGFYSCGGRDCPLPPPGTNQTVAGPGEPATYVQSDAQTFTRDVDVLAQGYRVLNGAAWCAVGFQGSVSCSTGDNGFTLTAVGGTLQLPAQP